MNLAKRRVNSEALTQLKLYLAHPVVGNLHSLTHHLVSFSLMLSVSRR